MEQWFPRTNPKKVNILSSHIFLVTFIASLLLSAISYINVGPINRDGALYIQAAQEFLEHGFIASKAVFGWPYFSILAAFVSKIFHLPLLTAIYVINTLLIAAACSMFVAVIKRIGANSTVLMLAAITILGYWFFNTSRNDILRDCGYWFFYLSAIYFLLKCAERPTWLSAIGWNLSIIFSILFRPEAIVFFAVPLVLFFHHEWTLKEKFRNSLKINFLVMLAIVSFIIFLLFSIYNPAYLLKLINLVLLQLKGVFAPIFDKFMISKHLIATDILNDYSARHAYAVLIAAIVALVSITFFNTIGVIYVVFAIYGLGKKAFPKNHNARNILIFMFLINIAMLFTFVSGNYFLSKRYAAPSALIVLTLIPYALEKLLKHRKTFIAAIGIIVLSTIVSVVHLNHAKDDIITAGKWIDANTTPETKIATNDRRIAFYAHRKMQTVFDEDFSDVLRTEHSHYDVIALRFTKKDEAVEKKVAVYLKAPNKVFESKQEKILIYLKAKKISK